MKRQTSKILSPADRRRLRYLTLGVALLAATELVGVASVFPFMALLADPGQLATDGWATRLYNAGGFTSERGFIVTAGLLVIILILVSRILAWYINYRKDRLEWGIYLRTSARLLRYYVDRPYAFFTTQNTADLRNYLINDTMHLMQGVLVPAFTLLIQGGTALVIAGLLLYVNPLVALTAAAVLGGAYMLIFYSRKGPLERLGEERFLAGVRRNRNLDELFTGIKTIKAYGHESAFLHRYREHTKVLAYVNPRLRVMYQVPRFVLEVIAFCGVITVTLVLYVQNGNLAGALPTISLFAVAGYRLLPALQGIFGALSTIRTFRPTLDQLRPDLEAALVYDQETPPATVPLPFTETIRLAQVDFSFPGAEKPLFSGLNLTIARGTTVALVGTTGSGKTTAADLLTGLLHPSAGHVFVDGTALGPATAAAWRDQIAYVPQHVYLYDASLRDNITFGLETPVDDGALLAVLDQVALSAYVREAPKGLDTMLGENGVRLSGGQRQRIGLARALLRRPALLVLDEATSALDTVTEAAVLQTLTDLPDSLTVVIIAHRLSTVRQADVIHLMEEGKIVASGSYGELAEASDGFRRMTEQ